MYEAIIAKITNVRKHPNADRLQLADCVGYQVIVGLDNKEGELGVYFPTDGRLSIDFLKANDLIACKDAEGNKKGGLFDEKGKVRTQKLRGEKSEGFWCPIGYLNYLNESVGTKPEFWDYVQEGYKFSEIGGHVICERYETQKTKDQAQNNKQGQPRTKSKWFPEHVDTAQFMYELDHIPVGSRIVISEKLHGTCLPFFTNITMYDGTYKKINKISKGDLVLGVNTDGALVPSMVKDVIKSNSPETWLNIKVKRTGVSKGNHYASLYCTSDHLVWRGTSYVEAKNICVGDKLTLYKYAKKPSHFAKQVIIGKLLGDGYLCRRKWSSRLEFGHTEKQEAYLDYTLFCLGSLANPKKENRTSGYGSKMIAAASLDSLFLNEFSEIYNEESGKQLTSKFTDQIGPIALAFWYMDDGSLAHHEKQKDRANFAVCAFDDQSCRLLLSTLNRYGISGILYKDTKGYNRIRLNNDAAEIFFDLVAQYIPPSMQYKLPESYRGRFVEPIIEENKITPVLIEDEVISVGLISNSTINSSKWDITTETHNFFAANVLVHNSQREGLVYCEYKLPWYKKALNYTYPWFKTDGYEYRVGTRRVVLHSDKPDYYNDKDFRYNVTIKDGLFDGEIIYGEIVGFLSNGKPIMGEQPTEKTKDRKVVERYGKKMCYSYGCAPKNDNAVDNQKPQQLFYVYRIVHKRPEYEHEFTQIELEERCKVLNANIVPVLNSFIYDGNKEWLKQHVIDLAEGESTLDSSHIKEGVVLRIETPEGRIYFLKYKSFLFRVMEGLVKEQEDYVDVEEAS